MSLAVSGFHEWWRPEAAAEPQLREGSFAFAALMAFTGVMVLAPQNVFPAIGSLRIALLSGTAAIAAHLMGRFVRGEPLLRLDRETALAFLLLAWAVVTAPLSYWPGGTVSLLTGHYLKAVVVFWLLANIVDSRRRLQTICWALVLMMFPLTLTGIGNFLGGTFIPGARVPRIIGYDAPLTRNPNDLALMLNLVLPVGVGLFLVTRHRGARLILGTLLGLQAVAVVMTYSRAGFLTLAAIGFIYLLKLGARGEWGFVGGAAVLLVAALPFLPKGYADRLATISNIDSDTTTSAQTRWADQQAALSFVMGHPLLGAGAGMDVLALNQTRGSHWVSVHNVYLQYAVGLGLPGLALFVALLMACLASARRAQRRGAGLGPRGALFHLSEGLEVSLLGFALAGLFHPVAYNFYFFYIGGLAVAARAVAEGTGPQFATDDASEPGAAGWARSRSMDFDASEAL